MKRFFIIFWTAVFFAAGCGKSDPVADEGGGSTPPPAVPVVTTSPVTRFDTRTATLGGSVAGIDPTALTEVGVQWVAAQGTEPAWEEASTLQAPVAAQWSAEAEGLDPATRYAVRAYVRTEDRRYYGSAVSFTTDAVERPAPHVVTADVTDYDGTSARLGGSVARDELEGISSVGVEYALWCDAPTIDGVDWSGAVTLATEPTPEWSLVATGLADRTQYAVRAFAAEGERRWYGDPKSFYTYAPEREALTVKELRARFFAGDDVSEERVRGYVALSVAYDDHAQSFGAGTVILYDNTGEPASALTLYGSGTEDGIGAAGLRRGDYVEVALAGAEPDLYKQTIPQYGNIARDMVRVIDSGHAIDPVWATPAELNGNAADYVCSPVKLSRMYAEHPGALFSAPENYFTDGDERIAVYAKPESEVGRMTQNGATGTLYGICSYYDRVQVIPVLAEDVADFTGEDGGREGDPAIEVLYTDAYEFIPQGETRTVACRITKRSGQRLYADLRNIDTRRFSVDIAGETVRITARPNTTGRTDDYANCYLYLASTKEGPREATATIRIMQLSSVYESVPALITANGGKLSSVHEAVVNGYATEAMKFGSGNYTGHYTSSPLGVEGDRTLVLYAVGWSESKHEAGTLYLRVEGGGTASTETLPLRINEGATGQAPFLLRVDDDDRYEVELHGLNPSSSIAFSTSPDFDYRKDERTGRALIFGVQLGR